MKYKKEFKQIDLTGKVYGEFNLNEIINNENLTGRAYLKNQLEKASRGDCIRFTGETYLMKVTD